MGSVERTRSATSLARRGGEEESPRVERPDARWQASSFQSPPPLAFQSHSTLFSFFLERKASPPAPRSRRNSARFSSLRSRRASPGLLLDEGDEGRRNGGSLARGGRRVDGGGLEGFSSQSYLNASLLLSSFSPPCCSWLPSISRKKKGSELRPSTPRARSGGGGAASLASQMVERVRAQSYVPREARTAKDMATRRGAKERVRES